ncbi:KUP/HAK/KT family potassium transporter [Mediterraneibacter glycyrrhizinilyticus]|uniref:KUP/HAK/KT family potassium transporter n=1 Tax=Mediterraneibacter glycyrrhizinilyticus TaxID=342942 RepID=UPI00196126D9|nr:KUP/HAK/KT family potassium transporter [Mediterraneibacter glycyrrhizinilyticus]MBM6750275.1 KUP/HAK/KT family potassium transporter [Mediterraneibacter glycyrrhizinilyticus]
MKKIIEKHNRVKFGMILIAIGVVYGDIGTSPMYVMKSVIAGNGGITNINRDFILGALSLVIWTITLLTTVKYVLIAMKADNHGEGGIFSLFSLVRKQGRWLVWPAMIGGAALLADGVLTPAVTVTTAIEGIRSIPAMDLFLGEGHDKITVITLVVICILFLIQRAGTNVIGKIFGPVMMTWFLFLAVAGIYRMGGHLYILQALNPVWAVRILLSPYNREGFMILGSVFLAATGAEALYSDMGHVGKQSIYFSWPFVKICLILNYLGQGAWLIENAGNQALSSIEDLNPFFLMLPEQIRPAAVLLGAAAAVIASQALISGSFTLVSEAIRLDLMPHMQIIYPSRTKGQLYISLVNTVLWIGCTIIVLYFRTSARMEAAYGLAITLTMLMTTLLLTAYLTKVKRNPGAAALLAVAFGALECVFFFSSLGKFFAGGYVAMLIAMLLLLVMYVWDKGTQVEQMQSVRLRIKDYIPKLRKLKNDVAIDMKSENMVFIIKEKNPEYVDRDVLYSILDKEPKRAQAYWFVHIYVTDEPYTSKYKVENYGTDFVFNVGLFLGFKEHQRINVYLRQIVTEMIESGELPRQNKKYSIYQETSVGSFKFCMIRKTLIPESDVSPAQRIAISLKYAIRHIAGSPERWYGLENSSMMIEYVPLFIQEKVMHPLERFRPRKKDNANTERE